MEGIRRLEKLSQTELSSLVLKLKLRGFREADEREARRLPVKHFHFRRSEGLAPDIDDAEHWVIIWNEPLVE